MKTGQFLTKAQEEDMHYLTDRLQAYADRMRSISQFLGMSSVPVVVIFGQLRLANGAFVIEVNPETNEMELTSEGQVKEPIRWYQDAHEVNDVAGDLLKRYVAHCIDWVNQNWKSH